MSGQQCQGVGYIPLEVSRTLSGTHLKGQYEDYFIMMLMQSLAVLFIGEHFYV